MVEPRIDKPGSDGSAGAGPSAEDAAAELGRLLADVRALGARLFADAAALARAQWRLTVYVVAGSARILAMRAAALAAAGVLGAATWVLLNVAIWKAVAMLAPVPFLPPLALTIVNGAAGLGLVLWQKGLKLE